MADIKLRSLGLIGGMSWQSTQSYYALINTGVQARCGGNHSAPLWLYSFDFAAIEALQEAGEWDAAGKKLADVAMRLEDAGAQGVMICTNTMHKLSDYITKKVSIPLLHIVDATAEAIEKSDAQSSLLLATRYTMEQDFYRQPLGQRLAAEGRQIHVPDEQDRAIIHHIIYEELCQGVIKQESRTAYQQIIQKAADKMGCDGVILGCTEIGLLIDAGDTNLTVFDTTQLHCEQAISFICQS